MSDAATKPDRLVSCSKGEAKEEIKDCVLCASPEIGHREARHILEMNYGQRHNVIGTYLRQLTEGPPIRPKDNEGLARLAREMRNCEIVCKGYQYSDLDTQQTIGQIFRRLPIYLQEKFASSAASQLDGGRAVSFSQLSKFLLFKVRMNKSFLGQLVGLGQSKEKDHPARDCKVTHRLNSDST